MVRLAYGFVVVFCILAGCTSSPKQFDQVDGPTYYVDLGHVTLRAEGTSLAMTGPFVTFYKDHAHSHGYRGTLSDLKALAAARHHFVFVVEVGSEGGVQAVRAEDMHAQGSGLVLKMGAPEAAVAIAKTQGPVTLLMRRADAKAARNFVIHAPSGKIEDVTSGARISLVTPKAFEVNFDGKGGVKASAMAPNKLAEMFNKGGAFAENAPAGAVTFRYAGLKGHKGHTKGSGITRVVEITSIFLGADSLMVKLNTLPIMNADAHDIVPLPALKASSIQGVTLFVDAAHPSGGRRG